MVPVLETARLRLRAFREQDLDPWAAAMADPAVVRYLGGSPFAREDTWRRVASATGVWLILGYGYWAVERKRDGALIGQVGFADFKREMEPRIDGLPEMGWIFVPSAQGKGYASEAVAICLEWAAGALPGREIVAIIDPDNGPSIRVAEKAGFASREAATYKNEPILLFRRPA